MVTNNNKNIPTAASGKVLQGQGVGSTSNFSTCTYPSTSAGTGKILYDNGTNFVESVPTFPASASATNRTINVSDGTNWNASTETWAIPGSSGNVLTSNGTNWTSAAAISGNFLISTITLTSAQIKALHATPIEIIAAPGAGKGIIVVNASAKLNYGGTNAFTAGSSQSITIYYNNNVTGIIASSNLVSNSMITSTTNRFSICSVGTVSANLNKASGVLDNVNVAALQDQSATEISGNAANNNTIDIQVGYFIVTF